MNLVWRRLVLAFLSFVCLALAPRQENELLARARAAVGRASDPAAVFEGRGKAHASGVDGDLRVVFSGTGSFRMEFDSELPTGAGFDGTTVWTRDRMGLARAAELSEADRWKLFAWVLSGHWLEASTVEVNAVEVNAVEVSARSAPSELHLGLAQTPMEMTLALDPASGLPKTLVYEGNSGANTWAFDQFVEVGGRRVPRRWTFDEASGLETFEVESYRAVLDGKGLFEPDLTPPADVRFDPEVAPELEVERVPSGHLLVEASVEGEDAGLFIFDTGAGSLVIDGKVADELGLLEIGEVVAVGVAGRTTCSFRRGSEFALGPLTLRDPVFVELDLGFLRAAFGRKIAGIVGYDVLARCVAEVETATPYVALHDPGRYALPGGAWQDLVVHGNTPCARARFEGEREGLFRLDTGAGGTVAFHAPAVSALGLLAGREVRAVQSGGVGGAASAPEGELAWFELASHRFEKPRAIFSQAKTGAFTDLYTTGNIGQVFLAPFRMVLDYPHDRLAFLPLAK